jgi:hypothetical protein
MKSILALVCLSVPIMIGCSQTQTSSLQDQCSAGNSSACEELARTQRPTYQEQQTNSDLDKSRPMIPTPSSAIPPARHFP